MIIEAVILNQPYSGEYIERIYDNENSWNSPDWAFVKFIKDDHSEWCGHFRGFPRQVAISTAYNLVLVLTFDYLFQLDRKTGNMLELEGQPQYQNLTVDPNGNFLLADYYNIELVKTDLKDKEIIDSPIQMDMIEFIGWNEGKLEFSCDEFLSWERHFTMTYDSQTAKIEIGNSTALY